MASGAAVAAQPNAARWKDPRWHYPSGSLPRDFSFQWIPWQTVGLDDRCLCDSGRNHCPAPGHSVLKGSLEPQSPMLWLQREKPSSWCSGMGVSEHLTHFLGSCGTKRREHVLGKAAPIRVSLVYSAGLGAWGSPGLPAGSSLSALEIFLAYKCHCC